MKFQIHYFLIWNDFICEFSSKIMPPGWHHGCKRWHTNARI